VSAGKRRCGYAAVLRALILVFIAAAPLHGASAPEAPVPNAAAGTRMSTDEAHEIIARQYRLMLGREPDSSGLENYTKDLVEGGKDERWLERVLAGSPEARGKRAAARWKILRIALAVAALGWLVVIRRRIACAVMSAWRWAAALDARVRASKWRRFYWLAGLAVFLALALRQHLFVNRYAVNMMFLDAWNFYRVFFENKGWWDIFTFQHGPHRQGITFFATALHAHHSDWNVRWDAFAVSFTVIAAAALGAWLLIKSGVSRGFALAAAGVMILNIRQYEIFTASPNLSPQAAPLLFLMAIGLCWRVPSPALRLPLLAVLTFNAIFTGYGLFAGLVVPAMLLVEIAQTLQAKDHRRFWLACAALAVITVGWEIFSDGYKLATSVPGFRFPHERPLEYAWFVALMLANFHGVPGHAAPTIAFGLVVCAGIAAVCALHGRRLLRRGVVAEPLSAVIFCLSAFTLLYCANTAVGRVCLGLDAAPGAPRYVTLIIPSAVAVFLHLHFCTGKKWRWLAGLYVALLAAGTLCLRANDRAAVRWFHDGEVAWRAAYLETHDELTANERAHFEVYGKPGVITDRLRYLEEHRLNLFAPGENRR
jgi:hypothetical protein